MARAGILYSDVAKAAAKLTADGKNPTVDGVRDALGGTGSKSTIAPFLKRWKAEHQGEIVQAEASLPPSLINAVKGLHQHMQAEFAQQLEQAQQQHALALRAAIDREEQWRTEHQIALMSNTTLTEDLARAREALAALQATHHAQNVTLAAIQAENAGLQQRLADRAGEVATLDHQLSQTRAQFEHYQESAAAQRAEERQGYEQRITRLEHDLVGANRQITVQHATIVQKEGHIAHLTAELEQAHQAIAARQDEATRLAEERARFIADLSHAQRALREQEAVGHEHGQKLATLRAQAAEKDAFIRSQRDQLTDAVAKVEALTAKVRALELETAAASAKLDAQRDLLAEFRSQFAAPPPSASA